MLVAGRIRNFWGIFTVSIEKIRLWLVRKSFNFITPNIDYSIKRGDIVATYPFSGHSELEVMDVNWALRAVAVRHLNAGSVVVLPAWSVRKLEL